MPPRKQKKLEKEISEIMIVNNRKLAPYIEAVNFSSRNIDQKKLGNVLGVFEIKDTSEDSAYIVNFLASVVKKTYFASHHKNALESFEATLYRLNLSLSEVAKHGNVNWIGKIDAVLCAIDEKNIHFSVSGDAKVLLLREGQLTEISGGLSPQDEAINPIKTFTDIASGKLEDGDRLIITTDDISHIFTIEELEKHALSFNKEDFTRFLKTALINELSIAGTIVVNIEEKIVSSQKRTAPPLGKKKKSEEELISQSINAFSNKTFEEVDSRKGVPGKEEQDTIEKTIEDQEDEYTHKKTGHIYIKDTEEEHEPLPENNLQKITLSIKESFSEFYFWIKDNYLQKGRYHLKKNLSSNISKAKHSFFYFFRNNVWIKTCSLIKKASSSIHKSFIKTGNYLKNIIPDKSQNIDVEISRNYQKNSSEKFQKAKKRISNLLSGKKNVSGITSPKNIIPKKGKKGDYFKGYSHDSFMGLLKKIIPNFSKITKLFSKMNTKNRLSVLIALAIILIIPIFIVKMQDAKKDIINELEVNDHQSEENLAVNPSSDKYTEVEKIYFNENIIGMVKDEGRVFIILSDKIVEYSENEDTQEYSFPNYAKNAYAYSFMKDLNLIFTINEDKKITSFSPISGNFNENNINIPGNADIAAIGTYLTYIYLADSQNNQIYRYPRAEGGFGERVDWLKEDFDLSGLDDMVIDENIYLVKDSGVARFKKGRKENFELDIDTNSRIEEMFTLEEREYIYALDKQNGEILKFKKDGSLVDYNSNGEILRSTNLWSSEEEGTSYFSTKTEVFKIQNP
jgi:hypothetical protein